MTVLAGRKGHAEAASDRGRWGGAVLNGNELLLTRFDGQLVKFAREEWWETYVGADAVIPDQ